MPYRSLAQERYFNVNKAKLEKQGVNVDEWNRVSKGRKLPRKVKKKIIKTPKSEMVKEHRSLVKVLRNPTRQKLSREAKKQSKELREYLKKKGYK